MLNVIQESFRQGYRTMKYPDAPVELFDRYRGLPMIHRDKCAEGCKACVDACPTNAITMDAGKLKLDMGRCLFCTDCMEACPSGAVEYTRDFSLAARNREDLVLDGEAFRRAKSLDEKSKAIFGRSLQLRQVSAGGCNGCEFDTNVLNTVGFDLSRFGIKFLASPRHCDGLLITGPVTQNMQLALKKCYDALPTPKFVIAVGACAISGGPYIGHEEVLNGATSVVPVDLYIPGCPPHPMTILDGLLRLLGRLEGTPVE
jgi:Ni,Fe-hydrogenase III small subunit/Pyruvate/2-oxoacid:ferredoxin oxidoreductase delta subunit